MKIVLIRHGQTAENAAHRHQPNKTPLSDMGFTQAKELAGRLEKITPTHVVSSPIVRALQTASVVGTELDLIPSVDWSLGELERPKFLTGYQHFSLRSFLFYKLWFVGLSQKGESYKELRDRIVVARMNLEKLPTDAVVCVVSHTVFINLFVAHLNRPKALWPWQAAVVFWRLVRMPNTGIIELTHVDGKWQRTQGESA